MDASNLKWLTAAKFVCPLAAVFVLISTGVARSQETAAAKEVLAKVNGQSISRDELEREIRIAFGDRRIAPEAREALEARTLEQLVKRRLISQWFVETKQAATKNEVDRAISQLSERLKSRGSHLEKFLADQQLDDEGLRRSIAWQIGWSRYLERQLTDKNIERFFDKHRRDFDGTELHVAHIHFKVDGSADEEEWQLANRRASEVLVQIRSGKRTFAEAAGTHSDGPTRSEGGDIGFISRHGSMPEAFSAAAFKLEPQQVSEPIRTPFGVHLIHCMEVKAGSLTWRDARPELEEAMTEHLFDWAADQSRRRSTIEYLGEAPKQLR